jgi:hypothetical protein
MPSGLLARYRSAEVDRAYAARYDAHPLDGADEWGDLEVVLEPGDDPIPRPIAVNLDSVESVSLGFLVERMGVLSGPRMAQVFQALGRRHGLQLRRRGPVLTQDSGARSPLAAVIRR